MPTGKRAFSSVAVPKLREVFLTNRSNVEKDTSKEAGLMVLLENMETAASNCDGEFTSQSSIPQFRLSAEPMY